MRHSPGKGKWFVNILPKDRKRAVIAALVEGSSIRSTERMTGVHRDTIVRLLHRVGAGCALHHDEAMYGLNLGTVQIDEIWAYVGKKQKNLRVKDDPELGDWYTFVALDNETKLVPSYRVGRRTHLTAQNFIDDLGSRVENRMQIFSDSFTPYADCIEETFGANVDYAQIQKVYQDAPELRGRYSPGKFVESIIKVIIGTPDEADISTSYVERHNLTMRMAMRRFTRLTNAFSKTVVSLKAAVSLYFAHYNFVRIHRSTRTTPAMAAGVTDHVWDIDELLRCELDMGVTPCFP